MPHTYATVGEANDYAISGGGVTWQSEAAPAIAIKLAILESVSRRIDSVCHRSSFGSGFGPRIGVNYYDGDGSDTLWLRDDAQSLATLSVAATTGATPVTATLTTDYYLATADGYGGPPYRKVILHGRGSVIVFGAGIHTIATPSSTFGYSNVTIPTGVTVTSGLAADAAATTFVASSASLLSPGMTLLIGTEQIYLYAMSGTTMTIVRGVNGSTAAVHADTSTIARYQYDSRVNGVAKSLYIRRLKARDAGADGTSGGLDVSTQTTQEGEDTIIRRGLGDLLLVGIY